MAADADLSRFEAERKSIEDRERVKAAQVDAELKMLRRENSQYEKALATQEGFFERIVEATRLPVKKPRYKVAKQDKAKPHRSVVVPIYDQQYGQLVRPLDTPGRRGGYNTEIYDERQVRWVEGVTGNLRDYAASHTIDELIFVFGGDHVEGDEIFAGQSWQLEHDPCVQVASLAKKLGDPGGAIPRLIQFGKEEIGVPHVAMYAVDDNHGKVGGRKSGARPVTYSWNWLLMEMLRDKLRAEPIDEFVVEPGGSLFFYAAGQEFQAIHGHTIRGWGGIPFYGIQRYDAKSVRLHNRLFRYLLMGHIHQPSEITTGTGAEAIVSGDWVGPNNLSGVIGAASRPQQKVLYVAQKWGITESARIYLTDAASAAEPTRIYGNAV